MYGPKRLFLLEYGSHDTRSIDFPRVDGLSTDTPDLGRHSTPFSIMLIFFRRNLLAKSGVDLQSAEIMTKAILSGLP